jgi:serine/threonine protein phosphatase PrpC/anti-sigma regulatory factor (Ser/Thr protein kinase)
MAPSVSLLCKTVTSAQISVGQFFDDTMAQETARQIAHQLGFAAQPTDEIMRVVSELASRIARRAGSGVLTLRLLDDGTRVGIEIAAEDQVRAMDPERIFAEGNSTSAVFEDGPVTVNRLMDEREISSTAALGTRIVCRRWLRAQAGEIQSAPVIVQPWQVGISTRPCHRAAANGDAFVIRERGGRLLAGVIDGLGHGEAAQVAAVAAQSYVQSNFDLPLDQLFWGVSSACQGTRGVVMALVRFESATAMTSANLGNIETRTWTGGERFEMTVQRGFLGAQEDHVHVQQHRWHPDWMLVLHSDGLRGQWQWSDFPGLERASPQTVANQLFKALAKENDDATVMAVKCGSAES